MNTQFMRDHYYLMKRHLGLKAKSQLTQRAADLGYAPRYVSFLCGWEFSPFRWRVHALTPSG